MASSISLKTNLASLNAERRLSQSTSDLTQSFTRLSSGLRINKASDDAAGLAISESLKLDSRVFGQGIRNFNDGLSVLATADSAIEQLSHIVIRLQELAEQSANGTLGDEQRSALDEEAQTLAEEYFRIARSTEFNGRYLLRGDYGDLSVQGGYGTDGGVASSLGGAIGDGTFTTPNTTATGSNPYSVDTADFNGDGYQDLVAANTGNHTVAVALGNGDGGFSAPLLLSPGRNPYDAVPGDFDGDGKLDIMSVNYNSADVSIFFGNGDGTFDAHVSYAAGEVSSSRFGEVGDFNGDGAPDIVVTNRNDGNLSVLLNSGDGTFSDRVLYSTGGGPSELKIADVNSDGHNDLVVGTYLLDSVSILLGNGDGTFKNASNYYSGDGTISVAVGDFDGDQIIDVVAANPSEDSISFLKGAGDGTFSSGVSYTTGGDTPITMLAADVNGDGEQDIIIGETGTDKYIRTMLGNGDGSFYPHATFAAGAYPGSLAADDFNGDGVYDLAYRDLGGLGISLGNAVSGVAPLLPFSLATQQDALSAMSMFSRKLDQLSSQRGQIGAFEARITVGINTLQVERENYIAAGSQIVDADVAHESAKLVKNNILQQAGAAVLAQANQSPALALQLLGELT